MIERERIIALIEDAKAPIRHWEFAPASDDEMQEILSVYLAWLDAPEGFAESNCNKEADWLEIEVPENAALTLNGKRVRLVEVSDD